MNRGTKEGTLEEKNITRILNKKQALKFWDIFDFKNEGIKNIYAIHVIYDQFGKIQNKKIKPKSDIFLARGYVDQKYLIKNDYYLDEDDFKNLKLNFIKDSGISIKIQDSSKYQILKVGPETFYKIFKSFELGAGASIYCLRKEELIKNENVLIGWKTNKENFINFFRNKNITNVENLFDTTDMDIAISVAKTIKDFSNKEIYNMIKNDKNIEDYIFKGTGNFNDPYIANWIYEKGELKKLEPYAFNITTGSGRSKGDYTIVIKPKY